MHKRLVPTRRVPAAYRHYGTYVRKSTGQICGKIARCLREVRAGFPSRWKPLGKDRARRLNRWRRLLDDDLLRRRSTVVALVRLSDSGFAIGAGDERVDPGLENSRHFGRCRRLRRPIRLDPWDRAPADGGSVTIRAEVVLGHRRGRARAPDVSSPFRDPEPAARKGDGGKIRNRAHHEVGPCASHRSRCRPRNRRDHE